MVYLKTDEMIKVNGSFVETLFTLCIKRKKKTFSDLYACYFAIFFALHSKEISIKWGSMQKVHSDTTIFYRQQILLDYLKQLQISIDSFLNTSSIPVDDLMIFCGELDKISRFNDRLQNPVIMNFEFRSKSIVSSRNKLMTSSCLLAKLTVISSQLWYSEWWQRGRLLCWNNFSCNESFKKQLQAFYPCSTFFLVPK